MFGSKNENFQLVIGQRSRIRHSKALGLLIQKKDHSSGKVVNEWSKSGLEWSLSGFKWSGVV